MFSRSSVHSLSCSLPCISLVKFPRLQHCNGAYVMLDWNNASPELLRAACEAFVDISISSFLSETHWGEGSLSLSSTLPTELQLDSHCVLTEAMVPLCPSIRDPLSPRHCPLCALQPRTNYRLSYLLWDSHDHFSQISMGSLPTSVYSTSNLVGRFGDVVVYSHCKSYNNWCNGMILWTKKVKFDVHLLYYDFCGNLRSDHLLKMLIIP